MPSKPSTPRSGSPASAAARATAIAWSRRAAAGAAAHRPDLDEAVDAVERPAPPAAGGEAFDAFDRIDQAVELEVGQLGQRGEDRVDLGPPDQFVGDDHAVEGEAAAHREMLHRGDRDPPRTVVVLQCIELWGHRGLAVRRNGHRVRGKEMPHGSAVPAQCRLPENRRRHGQVAGQNVPSPPPDLAQRQRPDLWRYPLGAGLDRHGGKRLERCAPRQKPVVDRHGYPLFGRDAGEALCFATQTIASVSYALRAAAQCELPVVMSER